MNKVLEYLACPYTHKDRIIRIARFNAVNKVSAVLLSQGRLVYSPISQTHPIHEASNGKVPFSWDFWKGYDSAILNLCYKFNVLALPGWIESQGVQEEMRLSQKMEIPLEFLDPVDYLPKKDLLFLGMTDEDWEE